MKRYALETTAILKNELMHDAPWTKHIFFANNYYSLLNTFNSSTTKYIFLEHGGGYDVSALCVFEVFRHMGLT